MTESISADCNLTEKSILYTEMLKKWGYLSNEWFYKLKQKKHVPSVMFKKSKIVNWLLFTVRKKSFTYLSNDQTYKLIMAIWQKKNHEAPEMSPQIFWVPHTLKIYQIAILQNSLWY